MHSLSHWEHSQLVMGKARLEALGCVSQAVFLLSWAKPYGGLMGAHGLVLEVVGLGQAVRPWLRHLLPNTYTT